MNSPQLQNSRDTCTSCAGTMILEFASLSRLTGRAIYEEKARHTMDYLWQQRHRGSDLVGTIVNVHNGGLGREGFNNNKTFFIYLFFFWGTLFLRKLYLKNFNIKNKKQTNKTINAMGITKLSMPWEFPQMSIVLVHLIDHGI